MRLVTRTIWRAFPELDRFDDEQCRRFVRAASRGIVTRVARWGAVAVAGLVGVVLLPGLSLLEQLCIQRGWWSQSVVGRLLGQPRWMGELVYIGLMLVTLLSLGGLFGAVTRDFLLRRRVRRVLRTRGRCAQCTYFLGGLPVSVNLQVVCPECGFLTEVDRSLGELSGSADGTARFAPSDELVRTSDPWLTGKRLWRWTKRVAVGLAVVLLLAGASWGWYEWRLHRQAVRAAAAKPGAGALVDLMELAQLPGTAPDAVNGFELLAPLATKMALLQAELFPEGLPDRKDGMYFYIGGEWVAQRPESSDTELRVKERALNEVYSTKVMTEFEKHGVFDDMRSMVDAPLAIGVMRLPKEQPLFGMMLADYAKVRQFARWNGGRMRLAVRENDPAKFADAYGTTMGIGRMLEKQPVLIGRLVAIAIESLADGEMRAALRERHSAQWLDAYEAVWKKYERHEPRALPYEGERLFAKDTVCWVFADPSRVRLGKYSPALRTLFAGTMGGGGSGPVPDGRLGSFDENLAAFDAFYDTFIAEAALPRWQRKPIAAVGSELLLLKTLLPALEQSMRSGDQVEIDRTAMPLLFALERYRLEKGVYPATLAELAPRWLPQVPLDSWSGKPFGYKLLDASKDEQKRGFMLYTVGFDGVDNGGVSGLQPWEAIMQPASTGIDYIINDEKR